MVLLATPSAAIHPCAIRGNRSRYNDDVPFKVRTFQPADFETLWRVDQECFPPGISYSRAELELLHAAQQVLHAGGGRVCAVVYRRS